MWYRFIKTAIELDKPLNIFHKTDKRFIDPAFSFSKDNPIKLTGYGGEAYGPGFYTSVNKYVIRGYKGRYTKIDTLPIGTRILIYNNISKEDAYKINQKLYDFGSIAQDDFEFLKQKIKTDDNISLYIFSNIVSDLSVLNSIILDLGYDAIQYPSHEKVTIQPLHGESREQYLKRSKEIKESGDNILVINRAVLVDPKLWTKSKSDPESLTTEEIDKLQNIMYMNDYDVLNVIYKSGNFGKLGLGIDQNVPDIAWQVVLDNKDIDLAKQLIHNLQYQKIPAKYAYDLYSLSGDHNLLHHVSEIDLYIDKFIELCKNIYTKDRNHLGSLLSKVSDPKIIIRIIKETPYKCDTLSYVRSKILKPDDVIKIINETSCSIQSFIKARSPIRYANKNLIDYIGNMNDFASDSSRISFIKNMLDQLQIDKYDSLDTVKEAISIGMKIKPLQFCQKCKIYANNCTFFFHLSYYVNVEDENAKLMNGIDTEMLFDENNLKDYNYNSYNVMKYLLNSAKYNKTAKEKLIRSISCDKLLWMQNNWADKLPFDKLYTSFSDECVVKFIENTDIPLYKFFNQYDTLSILRIFDIYNLCNDKQNKNLVEFFQSEDNLPDLSGGILDDDDLLKLLKLYSQYNPNAKKFGIFDGILETADDYENIMQDGLANYNDLFNFKLNSLMTNDVFKMVFYSIPDYYMDANQLRELMIAINFKASQGSALDIPIGDIRKKFTNEKITGTFADKIFESFVNYTFGHGIDELRKIINLFDNVSFDPMSCVVEIAMWGPEISDFSSMLKIISDKFPNLSISDFEDDHSFVFIHKVYRDAVNNILGNENDDTNYVEEMPEVDFQDPDDEADIVLG